MKKLTILTGLLMLCCTLSAQTIRVSTGETDLVFKVANGGRLYQAYLGKSLSNESDLEHLRWDEFARTDGLNVVRGGEAYATTGSEEYYETAFGMVHNDGNRSTYLYYKGHEQKAVEGGTETIIRLADDKYPVNVALHYVAYTKENVIKCWSEISHNEKKPVTLTQFASNLLYFKRPGYYLNEYISDWAREVQQFTEQLKGGKKQLESKQGSRAAEFLQPFFELGFDGPAQENSGEVLMGQIGWNGNFRFTFEVDHFGILRVIAGINPFESEYKLKAGELFRTPDFYFTLSQQGLGQGSRNFQRWARNYQLKDGQGDRFTLLNNWENTYFDFDQTKLANIMKEGANLGVDLFLLDDGWFGNGADARNGDDAGLGDWEVNREKIPGGVPALVDASKDAGVKFGIWIEPEMVNPQSKLYRQHPDWALEQPDRNTYLFRNQLVLDLANPKVQDHVYGVVDALMKENPGIEFFKWDCNSPITNKFSHYQKAEQQQMYIDHVRGLYNIMERVSEAYPNLHMMLCSGGGGRCDYESLKHFTEFWLSDNTDPVERCYIQWGFSQFFPAKAMCAHVTSWNKDASVKFRVDVASMCKLGFDIGLQDLSAEDLAYCQMAIKNWNRLKPVILEGDMYRLVSPYESEHMSVEYVTEDRNAGVLFVYNLFPRYTEVPCKLKLQGLDAGKMYCIKEINVPEGQEPDFDFEGKAYSGEFLMNVGLDVMGGGHLSSNVFEISAK